MKFAVMKFALGKNSLYFAHFKFGGSLFSKTMPNFYNTHTMSILKIQQFP